MAARRDKMFIKMLVGEPDLYLLGGACFLQKVLIKVLSLRAGKSFFWKSVIFEK